MAEDSLPDFASRRKHRRVPFAFPVEVEAAGRRHVGACQRIAAAGLHVFTPHVVGPGQEVRLSFTLPDHAMTRIVAAARVLRAQREDGALATLGGMTTLFTGLDAHDEEAIQAFVLRCIRREEEYAHVRALSEHGQRIFSARFFGTGGVQESYVVDISEGGLYVRTLDLPRAGEEVSVDLYLPGAGEITRVAGKAVWKRPHDPNRPGGAGVGVQFEAVPEHAADLIREFVQIFGRED